jgi:hypothetical protein
MAVPRLLQVQVMAGGVVRQGLWVLVVRGGLLLVQAQAVEVVVAPIMVSLLLMALMALQLQRLVVIRALVESVVSQVLQLFLMVVPGVPVLAVGELPRPQVLVVRAVMVTAWLMAL